MEKGAGRVMRATVWRAAYVGPSATSWTPRCTVMWCSRVAWSQSLCDCLYTALYTPSRALTLHSCTAILLTICASWPASDQTRPLRQTRVATVPRSADPGLRRVRLIRSGLINGWGHRLLLTGRRWFHQDCLPQSLIESTTEILLCGSTVMAMEALYR